MKKYAFGIDIGGTSVKLGFFRTDGELLDTWSIPTVTENKGVKILPDIAASVAEMIGRKQISKDDIQGIGVGVPGPVGPDGTVYKCVNIGCGVFNIEDELSLLTGLTVKAGNDANVAALGEMWQGGGKGFRDLIMVTLGTGVGGGVIIDGKIVYGANGAAGEIGHIPMRDDETECCGCGKKGCLEQYASANGIVRLSAEYLKEKPDVFCSFRGQNNVTSKDIFDAAKKGETAALEIVEEFGKILGKGLASAACVVNPEVFVIGGGVSQAGSIVIETVRKYYKIYAFHAAREAEFKLAELGNNAGIYGGVKLVLES
jgi:glucokinase